MPLTGPLFLGLVIGATLVAFVGLVAAWPRLAGRQVGRVVARAASLLGLNLLVVLTAAALLNAQFLFFADWADLSGAISGSTETSTLARGVKPAQAAGKSVQGSAATAGTSLPALPANAGSVLSYRVTGPLSGITATVLVGVPPGYRDAANPAVGRRSGRPTSRTR